MEQEERHRRDMESAQDLVPVDRQVEIYKTFVETITAAESRRQQVSAMYISIIAAIVTVASAVTSAASISLAGIIIALSVTWFMSIQYFRKLAKAKFEVVKRIENDLPIAPFALEWKEFKQNGKFVGLTHVEMVLPTISGLGGLVYVLCCVLGR